MLVAGALKDRSERQESLTVGDFEFDRSKKRVTFAGQPMHITPKEYAFLECLGLAGADYRRARQILGDMYAIRKIKPPDNVVGTWANIVRKKLAKESGGKNLLETSRGKGYRLFQGRKDAAPEYVPARNRKILP